MASRDWPPEHTLNWTPRQREVLQLIAAGRTNAEIAETLGVSFAGAKWHVSEVISKLGVTSREEAAAYWRETNSVSARFGRGMAALVGMGTLKILGGAATAVAVVGGTLVGIAAITGGGSGEGTGAVGAIASPTPETTPLPTPPEAYVPDIANLGCIFESEADGIPIAVLDLASGELLLAGYRGAGSEVCLRVFGLAGLTNTPGEVHWDGSVIWPQQGADRPSGCGYSVPRDPSVPGILVCSVRLDIGYVDIVVDGSATRVPAELLPASLGSTFKYVFTTFDAAAQSVQVRFVDEAGNVVNEQDISPLTAEDPPCGPPPAMTEHITAVSPAHGETVRQADTPAGVCADARFEGLTEQGTWVRLYLDGEEVTRRSGWTVDLGQQSFAAPNGRLCYFPAGPLDLGRHTAMVEVRDPNDPTAPALETVTWSFAVVP